MLVLALAGVLAGSTRPAAASCAGESLSVQEVVDDAVRNDRGTFVGTVVSTTNDGTWATFAVDEVWAGDVADEVEVRSDNRHGPGEFRTVSFEPFVFEAGAQYLMMPNQVRPGSTAQFGSDDGGYELGRCSTPPPEFGEGFASSRPASARIIERDRPVEIIGAVPLPSEDDSPPWLLIGAVGAVVVGGAAGLVVLRTTSRRRPVDIETDEVYL